MDHEENLILLRRRNRILKAMKTRYHRTTQKFGIELPKTVKRALEIDEETGTTFWQDALQKEMGTVMKAFDILPEGSKQPQGREFIKCHVVLTSNKEHFKGNANLLRMEAELMLQTFPPMPVLSPESL